MKQVILVRKDLNMGVGKVASQVAHAAMLFILHRLRTNTPFTKAQMTWMFFDYSLKEKDWIYGGIKKIVLEVPDLKDMYWYAELAQGIGLETHLVYDEGLNCNTCVAIGPDEEAKIDFVTGHLNLLGFEYKNKINN